MATGLDSRFVCSSDIDSYFVNKDTGEALAGGIVKFYRDVNHNTPKSVYQLTGSPGNYTYSSLGSTLTLSSVGTYMDGSNNNIVIYYYPYTGTPDEDTGEPDLYYVTVESSGNIAQLTRNGWPNFTQDDNQVTADEKSFIPNGQFLFHNDDFVSETIAGVDVDYIAQGGWTVRRTGASTYDNTFTRITTPISGLEDYPRYVFNFKRTSFSNPSTADLQIQWEDVNKFSSGNPVGSQEYTLFFAAKSNDGNTHNFDVVRVYNYGSDSGSPIEEDVVGSFTVTTSYTYFPIQTITFPEPTGTIGTLNDDYVALAIRSPSSTFDVQFTDFAFLLGNVSPNNFPLKTDADMKAEGIAGFMPIPNPDGSDLYLPLRLTPQGLEFDDSQIGTILSSMTGLSIGELPCDGSSYIKDDYSSDGIPYSRLFTKIFNSSFGVPQFGTGANFVTAYINAGNSALIRLNTNMVGAMTAPVDTGGTTMTPTKVITGSAGFNYTGYTNGSTLVWGVCNTIGSALAGVSAGTSGMTVSQYRNNSLTYSAFSLVALSAAALAGGATGKYFDASNTTTGYRFWFKVGAEAAPAAGGNTLVEIDLDSAMTAADVASVIANAISGFQIYDLLIPAAAAIATSTYFVFTADSSDYYVWYQKNGAGADPAPGGTGIKVSISTGQTADQVATATKLAINSYQYATPDLRGIILKGLDTAGFWDADVANRFSINNALTGGNIGTLELDQFTSHTHGSTLGNFVESTGGAGKGLTGIGTLSD